MVTPAAVPWLPRWRPLGLALMTLGFGMACLDGTAAHAQRVVPKIGNICPMGYVDMNNGMCAKACPAGWMQVEKDVGGGPVAYACRKSDQPAPAQMLR